MEGELRDEPDPVEEEVPLELVAESPALELLDPALEFPVAPPELVAEVDVDA